MSPDELAIKTEKKFDFNCYCIVSFWGFFYKIAVYIPKPVPVIYSGKAHKALGFETEGLLLKVTKSVTQNTLILHTEYSQLVLATSGDHIHCPKVVV